MGIYGSMKQTGLGWDAERKAPVVSKEHLANEIKVRSSFKYFKTEGCPKYEYLCIIFGVQLRLGHYIRHRLTRPQLVTMSKCLRRRCKTMVDRWLIMKGPIASSWYARSGSRR
ncbi:uncharacterized protein LOC118344749 [Juglans regia]|uniref:Uncharacterized protein LOC109008253 n=1 Tax=Juglans regia TaxID=51240 RepID=A0A2I4GIU5_JUGRE|nr:uncharacterized protein LOC109008253 [Juglans regia]XP_035542024.1 uncharacterized protein LOC118344749 [Juglans regia]